MVNLILKNHWHFLLIWLLKHGALPHIYLYLIHHVLLHHIKHILHYKCFTVLKKHISSYDEFKNEIIDCGRNSWTGGSTKRSRICKVELYHQDHPPPCKVQHSISRSVKEAVSSCSYGFKQRHRTIRRVIEESYVLELLGS